MENNNEVKLGGIISFFREHPILVFSLTILLCSSVGYWSEYRLMQSFGINIVVFAEADDFLLAAFKNPRIFFFSLPTFAVGIFLVWYQARKLAIINSRLRHEELNVRKEHEGKLSPAELEQIIVSTKAGFLAKHRYNRGTTGAFLVVVLILGVAALFYLVHKETDYQLEKIRGKPSHYSVVELRTNRHLLPYENKDLVLVTATEKYVFFYLKKDLGIGETFIIPTASIASMVQIPFSEESDYRAISKNSPDQIKISLDDSNLEDIYKSITDINDKYSHLSEYRYSHFTSANLNFREGPSREHEVKYVLEEQTEIELVETHNLWSLVREKKTGTEGWVHSRYIKSLLENKPNKTSNGTPLAPIL